MIWAIGLDDCDSWHGRLAGDLDKAQPSDYEDIELMHDVIYECLALYIERETIDYLGDDFGELAANAESRPSALLDELARARDLAAADHIVDQKLADAMALLPKSEKRSMLLAFLGFPFYDIATLPLSARERTGRI